VISKTGKPAAFATLRNGLLNKISSKHGIVPATWEVRAEKGNQGKKNNIKRSEPALNAQKKTFKHNNYGEV
jgi:hypothetical protein